jgi:hypothetical protein
VTQKIPRVWLVIAGTRIALIFSFDIQVTITGLRDVAGQEFAKFMRMAPARVGQEGCEELFQTRTALFHGHFST